MPTVPTRTYTPPPGSPPALAFPQPSASLPSPFSLPTSSSPPPLLSSLYNPTYQTAPWDPNGNHPILGAPSSTPARDRAHSYVSIAKLVPNLHLLCVPWHQLGRMALSHLSSVSCGPLLKYDTVVNGVWYGACMIVSACLPHEATEFH